MMIFRPKGLLGTYDFSMSRTLENGIAYLKGEKKLNIKKFGKAADKAGKEAGEK